MATFQVGKATPRPLGLPGYNVIAPKQKQVTHGTYYVVSRGYANKMQGGKVGSRKGTLYGVFESHARAEAFIKANKLRLHAKIVWF